MTAAEQGVRQGAQYLNGTIKDAIIPSVRQRVQPARGKIFIHMLPMLASAACLCNILPLIQRSLTVRHASFGCC